MPQLDNPMHERFAQEVAVGKHSSRGAAYLAAGYECSQNAAEVGASRLLKNDKIAGRVKEIAQTTTDKAVQRAALSKEWVIERLMENAERALTTQPVLDKDGQPTGSYTYDGAVANRALELLGKHLGILIERREIGEPGEFDRLADEEVMAEMRKEAAELGLSSGKPNGRGNGTAH